MVFKEAISPRPNDCLRPWNSGFACSGAILPYIFRLEPFPGKTWQVYSIWGKMKDLRFLFLTLVGSGIDSHSWNTGMNMPFIFLCSPGTSVFCKRQRKFKRCFSTQQPHQLSSLFFFYEHLHKNTFPRGCSLQGILEWVQIKSQDLLHSWNFLLRVMFLRCIIGMDSLYLMCRAEQHEDFIETTYNIPWGCDFSCIHKCGKNIKN